MIKHTFITAITALIFLPLSAQAAGTLSVTQSEVKEFAGEALNDGAGYSVSSAGDVNNDGYDDVLVGAYDNDGGGTATGAVYLLYGQASALSDMTLNSANTVKFSGETVAGYAGWSMASAGDVNNDGFDDILIGAPTEEGSHQSAAYLIYGQAEVLADMTLNSTNTVKFSNETLGDMTGYSVASAGDVNNDGFDDILIGSINADEVYMLYGQSAPLSDLTLSASNSVKFTGESTGDAFGYSLSSAGDVNNDGYDDILVAAPYHDAGGNSDAGAAYLIYGQSSELSDITVSDSNTIKFSGQSANVIAASSVATAEDMNNDGYDDIVIGATGSDAGIGAAFLIYGQSSPLDDTTLNATSATKLLGADAGDQAGISVASAGDVNNDDYDDVLIGSVFNDEGGNNAGSVYVVFGESTAISDTTLNDTTAIELTGPAASASLGQSVASAGDVNGDGYDDIIMGTPTYNSAFFLSVQASIPTLTGDSTQTHECAATYTDPGATATDQYTSSSLSVSASTLSATTLGAQSLTYTSAANFFNIQGTTTRTVTVQDTIDPTITLTGDATGTHEAGTSYDDPGATATDTCDTDPIVTATEIDTQTLGEQVLTYTATDDSSNSAVTSRTITVQDTTSPVITLEGDVTMYVAIGDSYTDAGATAVDNFAGDITEDIVVTSSVDTTTAGTYTVTYTVSDPSGNAATGLVRTVIVAPLRVTTNGKFVRVFIGDELMDREKINKKRLKRRYYKLKTASFYNPYTTVAVLTAKKSTAKLTVLRLTEAYTLRKKVAKSFNIQKRNKVSLRFKSSKKRIISAVGKGEMKTTKVYKLTPKGKLKTL